MTWALMEHVLATQIKQIAVLQKNGKPDAIVINQARPVGPARVIGIRIKHVMSISGDDKQIAYVLLRFL